MKLTTSTKITIFIILPLILVLVILLIYYFTLVPSSTAPTPTPSPLPLPRTPQLINSPNNFSWQIKSYDLPSQASPISLTPFNVNLQTTNPLATTLGFSTSPNTSDPSFFTYQNSQNQTSLYFDSQTQTAQYNLNLLATTQPTNYTPQPTATITDNLKQLLTSLLNSPHPLSFTNPLTEFLDTAGPRFIPTPQNQAHYVKLSLNYQYQSLPIYNPLGPSITAYYHLSGQLVKLTLTLPPTDLKPLPPYSVKTLDQLKNTPASQFRTLTLSGNQQFSLSDQDITIDNAIITKAYLGFLYSPDSIQLDPYIFLDAYTQTEYGQVDLLLAAPALSPESYLTE